MSSGSVPTGNRTYLSTIAAASTAEAVTFADRYQYLTVANLSGTGGQLLYVTTDGSTPVTSGASNTQVILPGERAIIANELPLWYQSQKTIVKGSDNSNAQSLDGQAANPGTTIKLLSPTLSLPYVVEAARLMATTNTTEQAEEIVLCKKCQNKVKIEGREFCSPFCERLWQRIGRSRQRRPDWDTQPREL